MRFLISIFLSVPSLLLAQFDPPAGELGSLAIHAQSVQFISWANSVDVFRGPQQLGNDTLGNATSGLDSFGMGKAGENPCISLGDGGFATLQFQYPIRDGAGADFAVFENSFDGLFLELAFVEVSSDGINFTRFPATSNTDTASQISAFSYLEAQKLNNLAGKHAFMYGTPFDLQELQGINGLEVNAITHVRIVDVVGSINPLFCSRDAHGNIINDPFPTPFPSSGFDLDAVGVIHDSNPDSIKNDATETNFDIFPQPFKGVTYFKNPAFYNKRVEAITYSLNGTIATTVNGIFNSEGVFMIDTSKLSSGFYAVKLATEGAFYYCKLIVQ